MKGLYAITDYEISDNETLIRKTEQILKAGAAVLQYREKIRTSSDKLNLAMSLKSLCQQYNCLFIINDDYELAKQVDADGLHIGKDDLSLSKARALLGNKLIGVSCYNDFHNAIVAEQEGADYIAFGAFYSSSVKPHAVQADKFLLQQAREKLDIPVVAIGGITVENAADLVNNGADMLAVIGALYRHENSYEAAIEFNQIIQSET